MGSNGLFYSAPCTGQENEGDERILRVLDPRTATPGAGVPIIRVVLRELERSPRYGDAYSIVKR